MQNALFFLIETLATLYIVTYLLRFILQWVRADFYNPLSQFILRFTNPLVLPARRVLPSIGSIDAPTLVVLVALQCLATWLLLAIGNVDLSLSRFVVLVLTRLVLLTLTLYTVSIFVYVILSWIGQAGYSPVALILADLNEPILRPFRRVIPPIAGLDLSPLAALLLIQALSIWIQSEVGFQRGLL